MAENTVEGAHPTRMELLQTKNKLRLAVKGHRLLKEKRDTLLLEFMNLAKKAGETGEKAATQMDKARHEYAVAEAVAGATHLASAALATRQSTEAEMEYRNIMGIQLPKIDLQARLAQIDERGWGITSTHPSIDAAAREYETGVTALIDLAQAENSLMLLSGEVKKAKRRVNALEYRLIPQLQNTQKHIRMRLEEFEREGFYQRKMIKRKKEKK
jgi:V/A-type H+/Na+-transporting ATPase subunit D